MRSGEDAQGILQVEKEIAMLVLSRKVGEAVRINDNIRVIINELSRGRVKLVFDIPDDVRVRREEIYNQDDTVTLPKDES